MTIPMTCPATKGKMGFRKHGFDAQAMVNLSPKRVGRATALNSDATSVERDTSIAAA